MGSSPSRATLLVVEDSAASREALVVLLEEEGHRVLAVGEGAAALEAVAANAVDLVLLDVGMPKLDGLQVLERLRQTRSRLQLPVIMVTALDASPSVVAALERGANDYVTKPIDLAVLLARIHTQLELSELARLKDDFLRIASHDLKNPLTVILGAAEMLDERYPVGTSMNAEGRWLIEAAVKARARQMRRLIADFLDLGALRDGHLALDLRPVDLRSIAAQSVEDHLAYAKDKGLTLALLPGAEVRAARADAARVAQVMDNLVGNALKFCPRDGTVEIEVRDGDGHVRTEVSDTGPGLSEADRAQLFVRHARMSNRPTGGESSTGIGLSLCRQLVELQGGAIGADTRDGGGARFWFELPVG